MSHYGTKLPRKLDSAGSRNRSKTDVGLRWGIAVDSAKRICRSYVDSGGSRTEARFSRKRNLVEDGRGVWVGHRRRQCRKRICHSPCEQRRKAVRKLDSAGNEIWSRTDVGFGQGIAVDSAGNVYTPRCEQRKSRTEAKSAGNEIWSKTDVGFGAGHRRRQRRKQYMSLTMEQRNHGLDGNRYFQIVG